MQNVRKTQLLLIGITLAALAPFLNKAFHIDDPLFLWMAQQIAKHPLDPYGFSVNWASFPEPMWQQMQNPPLCSYYLAAIGSLFGWSEIALHAAFLFWAAISILGTYFVSRKFCDKPFQAALFTLFTPVFLVSATNVMCDVMLLALWLWSIELWLRGLEPNKWWMSILSALLIAAAALTKYFGIALVPLLALYTIWRNWRDIPRVLFLSLPIAAIVGYDLWTKSKYGHGLFTDAIFYSRIVSVGSTSSFAAQALIGLAFFGGAIIAPLFYLPVKSWVLLPITLAVNAATFAGCWFFLPMNPGWNLGDNAFAVRVETAFFAAIAANAITWVIVDLAQRRSAKRILLAAWLIGTFVFAAFLNWSIIARAFLPIAPVVAILLVRRVRSSWALLPAIMISAVVAIADLQQANSARTATKTFQERFRDQRITVWFQSHWGFQYYMQQWGATPLNTLDSEITSGDVMIVPANNTVVTSIPPDKVYSPEETMFAVCPYVTTMGLGTGASFYSSIRGPIPWAIDQVPPEKYYVARFR